MKKFVIILFVILFFYSCSTIKPKTKIDYSKLNKSELKIVETGYFNENFETVFNIIIDLLEKEGWIVTKTNKLEGVIKTEIKPGIYCEGLYGQMCISCRIDQRKGKIRIKWFCGSINSDIKKLFSTKMQKQWNYLLLKELKSK